MSPDAPLSRYELVARELRSGSFELFTCDVFDTLVWRAVARPTDLFVELGRRLSGSGLLAKELDPVEFSGTRQWAEADARRLLWRSSTSLECNLEEIWEAMPAKLIGGADVAELIGAELACEADHLGLHHAAAGLLTLARQLGIRTALVSDTYLSPEQLRRVVSATGFDVAAVDRIVTSSEVRLGKADGLLIKVAAAERIDPRRTLHFGDNAVSDLAAAREAGARAILAEVDPGRRAVTRPSPSIVAFADRNGTDGALGAAVRETLVSAGDVGESAAYQFGAGVVGPALAGFAGWASETAEQFGASTLHCLLREGAVIADLIARTRPNGPATRLVHASRWALIRAAVFDGTPEEIFTVIERRTRFRPAHLALAFDLDPAQVRRVLTEDEYHHDHRYEAMVAVAEDDTLREAIVAASTAQRRNVLAYLGRTLDLDHGPLVLCDIGWGGKIQATIDAILRSDGFTGDMIGLYLMLSETGVKRRRDGAVMLSYLPETVGSGLVGAAADVVQHHAAILERIATPEIGTLLEFDDGGRPVCRPDDHDRHADSLVRARQGVYDVTATLARMTPLDQPPWRDREFRSALLDTIASTIADPSPLLASELGEWQHDDLAGDDPAALVDGDIAGLVRYLNAVDAATIGWDEVFWLPGLAAADSPQLSAQLAAAWRGIDLAAITPVSETGEARIASFPTGSDLASHQTEGVQRRSPDGWQLLRLHAGVPSARSLRLDPGSDACLVQLGRLDVRITTSGGRLDLDLDGFTDPRLHWIGGRPHSRSIAAFADGGHLLIALDEIAGGITGVDVDWAFRTWPLDDGDLALTRPTVAQRTTAGARRAQQALRRRTR
jgi:FMN phosphatase YigB (HAD superfamily)